MNNNDPTQLLGGKRPSTILANGNKLKTFLVVGLFVLAVLITVTRDWSFVIRESGVTAAQIADQNREIEKIRQEYARRDVVEARLISLEKKIDQIYTFLLDSRVQHTHPEPGRRTK